MKQCKKIIIIFLIVVLLMPALCPFTNVFATEGEDDLEEKIITKGLNKEQRNYIEGYVRTYLAEAHKMTPRPFIYDDINGGYEKHFYQNEILTKCCDDPEHEYTAAELGQSGTNKVGVTYTNVMRTVCSVFTAAMLHQAFGVEFYHPDSIPTYRGAGYANPDGRGKEFFNRIDDNEPLLPGDIISWSGYGHSMIYIGCDPETGKHQIAETTDKTRVIGINNMVGIPEGLNFSTLTPAQARSVGGQSRDGQVIYGNFSRLKPELLEGWTKPEITVIQWPNGTVTNWDGEYVSTEINTDVPLFYAGIAVPIGSLGVEDPIKNIFNLLKDLLNYLIGLLTMGIRIPIVGLTRVTEWLITSAAQVVSTEPIDYALTLEDIVYNKVPFLDVNIFNSSRFNTDGTGSILVISTIKDNIAKWYYAFRGLIIVSLFAVLIYLGIRMAITNIAEEKAEYKRMLVDWFVSFFIVMFIHYYIIAIMNINDFLVTNIQAQSNMASLYENVREMAHSIKFTDGWYGTILYIALVWYMVKYAWKYIKRLLSVFILIILSPLVGISYAIDKIKDNRSQSLGRWLKEIAFTVLLQSAHALVYTVFMVGIVKTISSNNSVLQCVGACVFLVIAVNFMEAIEDIFETILGLKNSANTKETMDSSFEAIAKVKMAKDVVKGYYSFGKGLVKGTAGVTRKTLEIVSPVMPSAKRALEKRDAFMEGYNEGKTGTRFNEANLEEMRKNGGITTIRNEIVSEANRQQQKVAQEEKLAKDVFNTSKGIVSNAFKAPPMLLKNPLAFIAFASSTGVMAKKMITTLKRNGMFVRKRIGN